MVFQFWTWSFLVQFFHYLCQVSAVSPSLFPLKPERFQTIAPIKLLWDLICFTGLNSLRLTLTLFRKPGLKQITLCTHSFPPPLLPFSLTSCSHQQTSWGSSAQNTAALRENIFSVKPELSLTRTQSSGPIRLSVPCLIILDYLIPV